MYMLMPSHTRAYTIDAVSLSVSHEPRSTHAGALCSVSVNAETT